METQKKETEIEQLSLFDQIVDKSSTPISALPESATAEWKQLYSAIAIYAKQLKPTDSE